MTRMHALTEVFACFASIARLADVPSDVIGHDARLLRLADIVDERADAMVALADGGDADSETSALRAKEGATRLRALVNRNE